MYCLLNLKLQRRFTVDAGGPYRGAGAICPLESHEHEQYDGGAGSETSQV